MRVIICDVCDKRGEVEDLEGWIELVIPSAYLGDFEGRSRLDICSPVCLSLVADGDLASNEDAAPEPERDAPDPVKHLDTSGELRPVKLTPEQVEAVTGVRKKW